MDRLDRVGLSVVLVLLALMALVASGPGTGPERRPTDRVDDPVDDPIEDLVTAFARSRTATYHAAGSFERSAPDGARIGAEVEIVQRPPDRLLRQFGEVQGRRGDRLLLCPAPIGGGPSACGLTEPGQSFEQVVDEEVDAFRAIVAGPDPLYEVERQSADCWRMTRTRNDPRSGYGLAAELCVDPGSGAIRSISIDHGRVEERTVFDAIRTEVTDEDLEP